MVGSFKGAHFLKDIILTGVRWYPRFCGHRRYLTLVLCGAIGKTKVFHSPKLPASVSTKPAPHQPRRLAPKPSGSFLSHASRTRLWTS